MADKVVVKAEKREERGKNNARRLRRDGKIPVTVYGGGGESVAAAAELKDLAAILRSDTGHNTIFSLDMAGEGAGDVIFHERQIDPIKGRLIHADLRRIAKGEKIEVTVPIHLIGEAAGTAEDGVLTQQMREIKVLCVPSKIPEYIEYDVTELQMNESITVADLKIEEGIEVHEDPEAIVASVVFVKEPELEPTPEEELTEPELVGDEKPGDKPGAVTEEEDVEKP
ncbi:50S ribosomal protein L25/general stress protein Ctc [soil metagenome]|jgi:large subunit ribosomal protein L25|nr:50S ribosomal protein L25 [Acidobacteriota bacterium]